MVKFHGKHYYLGAWAYVLLDILYAIPIIGFIFLLTHAFSNKDENRRHYARSHFARFLLLIIISLITIGGLYLFVGHETFVAKINEITSQLPLNQ